MGVHTFIMRIAGKIVLIIIQQSVGGAKILGGDVVRFDLGAKDFCKLP
jgi:hypothetical protein